MPTSKRTWSLPLPVQPCAMYLRLVPVRLLDEVLHDDRADHRADERVLVLVERVRLERLGDELLDVLLAHVLDDRLDRADPERLLAHELEVLTLLAHVDRKRDDVDVVVLLQPPDGDRGVQTTGVCEYDFLPSHERASSSRSARCAAPECVQPR